MEHRTALGLFLALAVNRPAAAFSSRASLSSSGRQTAAAAAASSINSRTTRGLSTLPSASSSSAAVESLVDVDANLLHPNLLDDIDFHLQVASSVGVRQFVVPGSTVEDSLGALDLAQRKPNNDWSLSCDHGLDYATVVDVVFATAGVHPYHVEECSSLEDAMASIATLAAKEEVRCVGECGLDYSEGFPPANKQLPYFERQVQLACELKKPLFLHERAAFGDFSEVLRRYDSSHGLPPCLVHCFTGSKEELQAYVDMGFFISVAGGICRAKNGAELREAVKGIPLDRLMVETDAPYLGFTGCRKGHSNPKKTNPNVPSALPAVARALAECLGLPFNQVAQATLRNSRDFFGMKEIAAEDLIPRKE